MNVIQQGKAASTPVVVDRCVDKSFPSLEQVTSPTVSTDAAAYYLNRKAQTLRGWACLENGPVRPIRVHGRLAWPTDQIRRVMGVS